LSVWRRIT